MLLSNVKIKISPNFCGLLRKPQLRKLKWYIHHFNFLDLNFNSIYLGKLGYFNHTKCSLRLKYICWNRFRLFRQVLAFNWIQLMREVYSRKMTNVRLTNYELHFLKMSNCVHCRWRTRGHGTFYNKVYKHQSKCSSTG